MLEVELTTGTEGLIILLLTLVVDVEEVIWAAMAGEASWHAEDDDVGSGRVEDLIEECCPKACAGDLVEEELSASGGLILEMIVGHSWLICGKRNTGTGRCNT